MSEQNKMGFWPMRKLVINMSLPLMISLLVQSLYNIVDSIFVAQIGEDALTATSLAYPIQLLMVAVSVGTSVGINAMLSKSVGAKEVEKTGNIATTGVLLALVGTIIFMILGFICSNLFVSMFTNDVQIGSLCNQYLKICMIFSLGLFLGTMYQRFLQSVGNTFDSMVSLCVGAVTNIILDPILIFGIGFIPSMGIQGAAIATVIGQWASAVVGILLNKKKNPLIQPNTKNFKIDSTILKQIYKVGLPTIVTQALGSVMISAINGILMPFSSTAVAFFGVYYKLQSFLFMPMNGLGQAAIPIVGYNFGAKKKDRIIEVFKTMLPITIGIALIATIVFNAFPTQLLSIFSASQDMLAIGVPALRIISITFVFASVTMILGYAVSGLGNGVANMLAAGLRQVIVLVPCIYFLAKNFGISTCWWAFLLSEGIALLYAIWATVKELKKKGIL